MLSLLALAAQTATVTNEPATRAMRCATAAVVSSGEADPSLGVTSHFMYFLMQATRADPGGKPFLTRLNELAQASGGAEIPSPDEAKALLAGCDREFPLARAANTPRLPANAFDRDVMCMGVLSLLNGAAEEMKANGGDPEPQARIAAALDPVSERLGDDVLAQHGMDDEASFMIAMGDQLAASLALGHPQMVARACGVAI